MVRIDVSGWFPVSVGLMQDFVMSPELINVYMVGVIQELNSMVLERNGNGLSDW